MQETNLLETIRREAASRSPMLGNERGIPLLVLRGQTPESDKALLKQELVIRCFPLTIGRAGAFGPDFGSLPHLALNDDRPYRISRRHATVERRGQELFIVDPGSRSGSLVDGQGLGQAVGGIREWPLTRGRHRLRIGGENSPFLFSADVVFDDARFLVSNQVRIGEGSVPVALLYGHLCRQADRMFRTFFVDCSASLRQAEELIRFLLTEREMIDPLYYFSAVPDTLEEPLVTHALNLTLYAIRLARMIPVAGQDIPRLALAALFHDVGMYQIPPEIINKRDTITREEFGIIQRHSADGQARLAAIDGLDPLVPRVAMEHHERIDGRGYPRGLRSLSDFVELIAILDFFEALTHRRPQRGPVTPHEGVRMLLELQKEIFSPAVVKLFLKGFSLFPVYSVVRLNTGDIGQVVATHPDWPLRPTVRIFFDHTGKMERDERIIDLSEVNQIYIAQDISDRIFVDHYFQLNPKPETP